MINNVPEAIAKIIKNKNDLDYLILLLYKIKDLKSLFNLDEDKQINEFEDFLKSFDDLETELNDSISLMIPYLQGIISDKILKRYTFE